jgi:hypothetical protein
VNGKDENCYRMYNFFTSIKVTVNIRLSKNDAVPYSSSSATVFIIKYTYKIEGPAYATTVLPLIELLSEPV